MPLDLGNINYEDVAAGDQPSTEEEEETPTEDDVSTDDIPNPEDVEEEEQQSEEESPDEEETPDEEEEEVSDEEESGEEETEETDEPEVSLFEEIETQMGVDVGSEEKEYEETVEGLVEFAQDASQKIAEQQWQQVFEEYPDLQQYFQYRVQGGDPDEYQEAFFNTSYQDREVQEDDKSQQRKLIRENLSDDFEEEEIEDMLDQYEASGTLEMEAKKSLRQLQNEEEKQQEELLEEQEEKAKERQKQIEEYWDNVEQTIEENDEFKGLPIPKGEKGDFFEWMSKDVTDGQGISQRDQMVQEAGLETRLAIDLMLYYDFNLEELAEIKSKSSSAKDLRKRLKSSSGQADVTDESSNDVDDAEATADDIPEVSDILG
jgi:hypothetical protein